MDTRTAREIANNVADGLQLVDALPTCGGCPVGVFEEKVDRWLKKFANLLGHRTFLKWHIESIGSPAFAFVVKAENTAGDDPPFHVFPIARIEANGPTDRRLVIVPVESAETGAITDPAERDRIGELLEGQARIEARLKALEDVSTARHQHVGRELQRVMMFVNYFGRAPWVGTVTGWFTRVVTLGRPDGPGAPPK